MNHKIWRYEKFPSNAKINSLMFLRKLWEAPRLSRSGRSLCSVRLADHVPLLTCPDVNSLASMLAPPMAETTCLQHVTPSCPWPWCTEQPWSVSPLEFWSFTSQLGDWNPLLVLRPAAVGTAAPYAPSTASATTAFACLILKDSDRIATTFLPWRASPQRLPATFSLD